MDQQPTLAQAYQNKQEQIEQLTASVMNTQFPEVRNIYIDLNCLKDTRMGTLFAFAPTQEVQKYLIDNLDTYNRRLQRDFLTAYPEYPSTELELKMKYLDPANSEKIFNFSPDTDFCINIYDYLKVLMSQNSRAGYLDPVEIYINVYPHQITPFMKLWIKALQQYIGGYSFNLIRYAPDEMTTPLWTSYQVVILDDLVPCVQETSGIYSPLFMTGQMRGTEIYAPFQIEDKIFRSLKESGFEFKDEDVDAMFEYTALVLSICCNFHYMHFNIPKPRG